METLAYMEKRVREDESIDIREKKPNERGAGRI